MLEVCSIKLGKYERVDNIFRNMLENYLLVCHFKSNNMLDLFPTKMTGLPLQWVKLSRSNVLLFLFNKKNSYEKEAEIQPNWFAFFVLCSLSELVFRYFCFNLNKTIPCKIHKRTQHQYYNFQPPRNSWVVGGKLILRWIKILKKSMLSSID